MLFNRLSIRINYFHFIFLILLLISCSKKPTDIENNDTVIEQDIVYSPESIKEFEQEILGALSGETEIIPDTTLTERFSISSKSIARQYIRDIFKSIGLSPQRHMYGTNAENVYAILEATVENDEYIVLGAHFDSVENCPGADDNASGVTLIMAAARSMAGIVQRSKNLIFVLFDEEEVGLLGSKKFVQKLITDEINIHSMHNFDMLGWDEDDDSAVEIGHP